MSIVQANRNDDRPYTFVVVAVTASAFTRIGKSRIGRLDTTMVRVGRRVGGKILAGVDKICLEVKVSAMLLLNTLVGSLREPFYLSRHLCVDGTMSFGIDVGLIHERGETRVIEENVSWVLVGLICSKVGTRRVCIDISSPTEWQS